MNEYKIPKMLSIKDTAEITGLSYDFLRKGCICGDIVHIRAGNKFLINLDKLCEKLNGEESNNSIE